MIYLMCLTAFVSDSYSQVRAFFAARPAWIPFHRSVGEVFLALAVSFMMLFQWFYFYREHCYELKPCSTRTDIERAARAAGLVCNVIMGLLILPVSKNSYLTYVFNISWEAMIFYHRILGCLFYVMIAIHMFLWWAFWDQETQTFPNDILAVPLHKWHTDNFTVPLATIVYMGMLVFMGLFALPPVRRQFYEVFQYGHYFLVVVFMMVLWHATMSWYFLGPGTI